MSNPEESRLEDNHRYGIFDKSRELEFEKNYGYKAGVFAGCEHVV